MDAKTLNAFNNAVCPLEQLSNLSITFKKTEDVLYAVDQYFNFNYEDEWLDDPFVQAMIEDVDNSTVISANCIQSPVLGTIPAEKLSGGVKALILMLKEDRIIWATACGDNCAPWILEIAKQKKITICLEHDMDFPVDFDAYCIDNNKFIHSLEEYRRCMLQCLYCI